MKVVTYNPFKPSATNTINTLFDDLAGRSMSEFLGNDFVYRTPSVNIIENDDAYDIEIAAPGLAKEDFSIDLEKDQLIITGSKKESTEDKKEGTYSRREFNCQGFKRSFHISEDIDSEKVNAQYADGILTIKMAKKVDVKNPVKTIEIA
jgi:HSP20 family protein